MNNLESTIYNLVRKNPALKQFVRKEYFAYPYQYREGFFFGFHDVTPFSYDETKLLANQNKIDLRMPLSTDGLNVGYFDLELGSIKDFHRVDTSYAWNYHKGCRLQWLDKNRMIYNTAMENRLVSKIHDLPTGEFQVIDCPIDAVYQDGQRSLASSFSYERLERCMPGYGYPYRDGGKLDDPAPEDSGLFLVDLKENTSELLVSLSELAQMENESYRQGYMHFVTHSEFSKDGRYISFLYRKIPTAGDYMRRHTKIMVYDLQDRQLIALPTQDSGSHYVWNNKNQLIASCIINGNSCHVLYDMEDVAYRIIAGNVLNSDGHQFFISDTSFVTDTYPDKNRMAKIYKVDIKTSDVKLLVNVYSPKKFQTKDFKCHIACDLHPRISPSGKYVSIDSPRTGKRALYIMNL